MKGLKGYYLDYNSQKVRGEVIGEYLGVHTHKGYGSDSCCSITILVILTENDKIYTTSAKNFTVKQ